MLVNYDKCGTPAKLFQMHPAIRKACYEYACKGNCQDEQKQKKSHKIVFENDTQIRLPPCARVPAVQPLPQRQYRRQDAHAVVPEQPLWRRERAVAREEGQRISFFPDENG
jgi:hypothetical protein